MPAPGDDTPAAPSVWDAASAAQPPIPGDAHEYRAREALRDAAFLGLSYVPYCPHAPVCGGAGGGGCKRPRWAWRPKAAGAGAAARH